MKILQTLGLLVLIALFLPHPGAAADPLDVPTGFIGGQVLFPGFPTTSISTTAVGGGNTFQQTTYNSSQYQLKVPGAETSYLVSSSCGLSGGNNTSLTVSFSQRKLTVASGETTANEYVFNPGIVRFEVTITGDPSVSAYSSGSWATRSVSTGEKTAAYSAGTPTTTARDFSWEIPVVPNPQIELTAKVVVNGPAGARYYSFDKTASSPYTLAPIDVGPGELVIVPLEIHLTEEPPPAAVTYKGTLAGGVNLLGLPSSSFLRHTFNGRTLFANPDAYTRDYSITGNQYTTTIGPPNTYFEADIDSYLRWPYTNGDSLNNRVNVYPDTISYFDQERMGAFLRGKINLSGTVENETLTAITLNFNGFGRVYDAATKKWATLENYYGATTVRRDSAAYGVRRPHERDYQLFLTTGPWELGTVTLSRWLPSPSRTSSVTFTDHATRYDGRTYFGAPLLIAPGANEKDFEYCLGSARFRFWDPLGSLLKNPFVSGTGSHQTNGAVDLDITGISANSTVSQAATAEVEVFGPPGEYRFTTIRIQTEDGATLTYPARNLTLSCGTTKELDFPGPTLSVTSPGEGLITNAAALPVAGKAFGNSEIASVTINGAAATLTPVPGGSANEVTFDAALSFPEGANTITVTATDALGARTVDHRLLFVDRHQPTVSIAGLGDGDRFISTDSIPLQVEAADRGYGYSFSVLLDSSGIHSATGKANSDAAEVLTFDSVLRFLPVGDHVVTATVADLAGNVSSRSLTLVIEEPPPVLSGLIDQTLEASSAMGASATFDVTATSSCNIDPLQSALPAPIPAPQSHAVTSDASLSKTFHWGAVTGVDDDPVEYRVEVS
ncbi:MAG: hypothetical protein IH614_01160, partial [Desulfuromonadales bacterium]|nr:hypothetical protein [Desulfuromonadales bacterium]